MGRMNMDRYSDFEVDDTRDDRVTEDEGILTPLLEKERARSRRQTNKRRKPSDKRRRNDIHWM